jgi:hypothetical protein
LPEWDILILGGQLSLHIVCTGGTYFQCLVSKFFILLLLLLLVMVMAATATVVAVAVVVVLVDLTVG